MSGTQRTDDEKILTKDPYDFLSTPSICTRAVHAKEEELRE